MWKHAKSAGRILRRDHECGSLQKPQEEFQDQTMNVEAYKKCRKNFKSRLWKCVKTAGIISRPDYKCLIAQRV